MRGRDEAFDQPRDQQHRDAAQYELDRQASIGYQGVYAPKIAGHQQRFSDQQTGASRDEDRCQLDDAMRGNEGGDFPKAIPDAEANHHSKQQTVLREHPQGTDTTKDASRKSQKRYVDIVGLNG